MRATPALLLVLCLIGCDGDDDVQGDDDGDGSIDAQPANEPAGLEGITAAHNQVRAAHGVEPLTWDPEVAAIAQAWADQCIDTDGNGLIDHNEGRSDNYPEYVGENVYGSSGTPLGTDAVALWVEEEADYHYDSNTCDGVCGHYTQVVWRASTKLGCGINVCPGLSYGGTVVCNYAPGGNVNGERPY